MSLHIILVTGMSGGGRTTTLKVLEDLGFFCTDNLPPPLLPDLVKLAEGDHELTRVAFGVDVRTRSFLAGTEGALDTLRAAGHKIEVLFLDASDEALVPRFSATRRPHPLAAGGNVLLGIQTERERLAALRAIADQIIDTTDMNVHDLRSLLVDRVAQGDARTRMVVRVVSFGFKYGLPVDADLVFDLRYLPNPHFVPELKPKSGLDKDVSDFVLGNPEAVELLEDLVPLLTKVLPRYEREGKSYLTIAIGCTGGRHRSVAMSEELRRRLSVDRDVDVVHRDVGRAHR